MKLHLNFLILLGLCVSLISCKKDNSYPCIVGKGTITTENRQLGNFESVDLKLEGDIRIVNSSDYRIQIEGHSNHFVQVNTKIVGKQLQIDSDRCLSNTKFKFVVYMPLIKGLKISGASSGTIEVFNQDAALSLQLEGTGKIISNVSSPRINAELRGVGSVNLIGSAEQLVASLTGQGTIDAYKLTTTNAEINITGSAEVKTSVQKELQVQIVGDGIVFYKGNPIIKSNITGRGKIVKE